MAEITQAQIFTYAAILAVLVGIVVFDSWYGKRRVKKFNEKYPVKPPEIEKDEGQLFFLINLRSDLRCLFMELTLMTRTFTILQK